MITKRVFRGDDRSSFETDTLGYVQSRILFKYSNTDSSSLAPSCPPQGGIQRQQIGLLGGRMDSCRNAAIEGAKRSWSENLSNDRVYSNALGIEKLFRARS